MGDAWDRFTDENGVPEVVGSDGGVVVADEEYGGGARITLERLGENAFGITCGIYQWMMHTRRFSSLDDAEFAYEAMKVELAAILDMIPNRSDPEADRKTDHAIAEMSRFVDTFP